eukprot:8191720-Karenia_brevis.AAC.1
MPSDKECFGYLEDTPREDSTAELISDEEALSASHQDRNVELWCGGRVIIYTDGACRDNQHSDLRREG